MSFICKSNLESYLRSRNSFREMLNPDDYRYFSFQLWPEGVARYIEYRTAKLASQYFNPSEKFKLLDGYKSLEKIADDQSDHIMQRLTNLSLEEDKRVAFYPVGAAEALLLDQINPDWHKFYWKEKFYLERHFKSKLINSGKISIYPSLAALSFYSLKLKMYPTKNSVRQRTIVFLFEQNRKIYTYI